MPIGGNDDTFTVTGAKLKVTGGVDVTGSIAYTTDATGFGSVTAQIDNDNTLNITSGKNTGVTKIERNTAATITAITHTNVNNNTTIHLALKNTATSKGVFITLGTFASDDTVKVNYTDNYVIGPGETAMITVRKVQIGEIGVASVFVREMFTDKATSFDDTDNKPFYIKDGVNYKYPLYNHSATGLTGIPINGVTYYRPSTGITSQTRPPKGLPENVTPPSASSFKMGNNGDMTTLEYSVLGVLSNFDYGSITDGNNVTHARFLLTDGEAGGTFTESGASSGDSYKLFIEKTDTTLTDTVNVVTDNTSKTVAFHHGTFSSSDYSSAYSTVGAAATAGFVYSNTPAGEYTWGTLAAPSTTSSNTTYTWTPPGDITANLLMVAGGGAGGCDNGGAGGAGGLIFIPSNSITGSSQTITVGAGAGATPNQSTVAEKGVDTTFGSLTAKGGGCGANGNGTTTPVVDMTGGSGGGGDGENTSNPQKNGGTSTQSSQSGDSGTYGHGNAGGNGSGGAGGGGGGAGTAGANGESVSTDVGGLGGDGLKEVTISGTTYNFATLFGGAIYGEVLSGESWFAGGGGGGNENSVNTDVNGGKGGGGKGLGGNDQTDNIVKYGKAHTGGGGGGQTHNGEGYSGGGGSGIVIFNWTGSQTGKLLNKVSDIVLDSENESNVLISTQGTGISTVKYSINGGSEVSTPVSQLSVAHGLGDSITGTALAYGLDVSSARLGVKLSKTFTTARGYETITLTDKSGSQTITYVGNGTTDVTNTYKSAGGNTWNGGWILNTGYTAPVTFEYNCSAASSDDSNSYKQIGINDSLTQTYASGDTDFDITHYAYQRNAFELRGSDVTDESVSTSWNSTDTFYIVYKSDGYVEWWQASTKIKSIHWGALKTVYLSTTLWKQGNGSDHGSFKNIRVKRRQWNGTKYIN